MTSYQKKEKRSYDERPLTKSKYWDTVRLSDGGLIRVIKLRSRVYPSGY